MCSHKYTGKSRMHSVPEFVEGRFDELSDRGHDRTYPALPSVSMGGHTPSSSAASSKCQDSFA